MHRSPSGSQLALLGERPALRREHKGFFRGLIVGDALLPAQMPAKPQILSAVLSPGERFNFADEGPGVRRITLEDRLRDRFASDLTKAALALNSSPTVWTPLKNDVSGLTFSAQGSKFGVFDGARLLFSDVNPQAVIDVAAGFKRSRIAEQFELSQANRTTHRLAV